ncbi:MAG: endo-1,4-beta-xylanase [Melioribacteraceae bacterium]|nr:endo-1,4-beta-xylanase [Melioribacteraceae bacterium]
MKNSRRGFIKKGLVGAAALTFPGFSFNNSKNIIVPAKSFSMKAFPHEWMGRPSWIYLTDSNQDPFVADVKFTDSGFEIARDKVTEGFTVNALWYVEGFGNVVLQADNGGDFFKSDNFNSGSNLNHEFARSRIHRNRSVKSRYEKTGTRFSNEVNNLVNIAEEMFGDSIKKLGSSDESAKFADKSLYYSLWAGEKIELEHARSQILKNKRNDHVHFGCETRQYIWAKSEELTKRFVELFNFATITHYVWDTWYELFEPREGVYNWGVKDNITNWLVENNIEIEGRPLFWFHPVVTPDWLKNKNFGQLKTYVEKHTRNLVSHYKDKVHSWEVVNEYHDWANIHKHSEDEITEIVRLACDTTKDTNPKVKRLLNNCCPWAEYAARGRTARSKVQSDRKLRSPRKFIKDLTEAGVEYDILGIQIYFPMRDLSDIMRKVEEFEKFGKPIYITEMGASAGYYEQGIKLDEIDIEDKPYDWHRRWDEELQADWLEQVYTMYYSRDQIKGINWYDFSDFRPFIRHGGLVREDASTKRSFHRLKELLESWGRLPKNQ